MDLTDPTTAITPTLDGPVLAVLARSGRPLTAGEIAKQAARGSEIGIRKCLTRLVAQGIVRAVEMGRNRVHELNRQHVAAPAAIALAQIRTDFLQRFRAMLEAWDPKPVDARLFGSAARGDGSNESDIDLLLVRLPRLGEKPPQVAKPPTTGFLAVIADFMTQLNVNSNPLAFTKQQEATWQTQVDALRDQVYSWTGNHLQVVELTVYEISTQRQSGKPLMQEIDRDGIMLVKPPANPFSSLVR